MFVVDFWKIEAVDNLNPDLREKTSDFEILLLQLSVDCGKTTFAVEGCQWLHAVRRSRDDNIKFFTFLPEFGQSPGTYERHVGGDDYKVGVAGGEQAAVKGSERALVFIQVGDYPAAGIVVYTITADQFFITERIKNLQGSLQQGLFADAEFGFVAAAQSPGPAPSQNYSA